MTKSNPAVGDRVKVHLDARSNNGSDEAVGFIVAYAEGADGESETVNLRVLADSDEIPRLTNVPLLSKAPSADDEDVPPVYATY
jgi:hypothetical protein